MSSNILPPRGGFKKRKPKVAAPEVPEEPMAQMMPKKPRKMNMGNVMRQKNRRVSSPMV